MTSTIRRTWSRAGVAVGTVHPQYGELHRGWIRWVRTAVPQVCGTWRVTDQDSVERGVVVGDYRDAEALLMKVTSWADGPGDPTA